MHTRIIGFSGKKSSGKNTCVNISWSYLHSEYRVQHDFYPLIRCYGFADPLKRMCQQFFGLTHVQCYGNDEQKNSLTNIVWDNFPDSRLVTEDRRGKYMTAREVLQSFGTDIIRRMYVDAHVEATLRCIQEDHPQFAIIEDCRFSNEIDAIQRNNGVVIRLTRNPYPEDVHESEIALDPDKYDWSNFDHIIDNAHMTLYEQEEHIKNVMKLVLGNR